MIDVRSRLTSKSYRKNRAILRPKMVKHGENRATKNSVKTYFCPVEDNQADFAEIRWEIMTENLEIMNPLLISRDLEIKGGDV